MANEELPARIRFMLRDVREQRDNKVRLTQICEIVLVTVFDCTWPLVSLGEQSVTILFEGFYAKPSWNLLIIVANDRITLTRVYALWCTIVYVHHRITCLLTVPLRASGDEMSKSFPTFNKAEQWC